MREAERRERDEQVVLRDAELDVLAGRREFPVEGRGDALALERVGHLLAREQVAPVHPRAEVGRDGHVRRRRDDALDEIRIAAPELVEQRAEARTASTWSAGSRSASFARHLDVRRDVAARLFGRERHAIEEGLQFTRGRRKSFELVPFVPGTNTHRTRAAGPSAPASSCRRDCPCVPRVRGPSP